MMIMVNKPQDESPPDKNNSASSQQLPQKPKWNSGWRQDADQFGYFSEDSEFNSVSMTSVTTSESSTAREGQNREQEGKITLLKLNDDSSTNDLWIWLADAYRYVNSGFSMDALENKINRSLSNGF